jgi:nitronate monooxygenase
MGGVAGGRLAAAVTEAGGLGFIGGGYGDPSAGYGGSEFMEREFRAAGNSRFGIGYITWSMAKFPHLFEEALARKPAAFFLSFGDEAPWGSRVKAAGIPLVCQVQDVEGARRAAAAGADVIVAQGTEAGGHGKQARATLPLVPAIVDAVSPIPVVAAGGIADGRGLAAALMLGASGVLIGTRFWATPEALGSDQAKALLTRANGDDTLRTRVFDIVRGLDWPDGYTGRAVRNSFSSRWHGQEEALATNFEAEAARFWTAMRTGDTSTAVVFAGEGLDLIRDIRPAGEIVQEVAREAERLLTIPSTYTII